MENLKVSAKAVLKSMVGEKLGADPICMFKIHYTTILKLMVESSKIGTANGNLLRDILLYVSGSILKHQTEELREDCPEYKKRGMN